MKFIEDLFEEKNIKVKSINRLNGGDINDVYKVSSTEVDYVIKVNSAMNFPDMFEKEAMSLEILKNTNSFIVPEVIAYGSLKNDTYLILEYVPSTQNHNFEQNFAESLASLHQTNSEYHGLEFDNYIGKLDQINISKTKSGLDFYINSRLEPMFKLAKQKGFDFENIDSLYKSAEELIPKEKASLIHGDLWSGNYHITNASQACIYDPAICFASREMDLAMMKLFGGFPNAIFDIYREILPLENGWKDRIELWQLYYILVHVNLFGGSYFNSAKNIISKYTA